MPHLFSTDATNVHLLRDVDSADQGGLQHLAPPHQQVLQVVDGHVVVGWQEDAHVGRQEVVDLPLAAVLRRKLLRGDVLLGRSAHLDFDHVLIQIFHIK